MKILVTGGTGFIGSHTVVELMQAGFDAVVIDNLENSDESVVGAMAEIVGKEVTFLKTDLRKPEQLSKVFDAHPDIEAVIHFAAYKAVGESVAFPLRYYENNISSTVNLLKEMEKRKIGQLVFSSSCTVYGDVAADQLPVTEHTQTRKANSPYGNTKMICEDMLTDVCSTSQLRTISLRYFNPIGAHDSALIGELPIGKPNNLVPFITQTAAGLLKELTIFGNDYPTQDGTCIRDYIHVVDLAKAHVQAIRTLSEQKHGANYLVYNIGTGRGNSVVEVIRSFEKVSGLKLNYKFGPRRAGDVVQIYASCDLAKKELGWEAERDLDNSMLTAWKWQKHISALQR